MGATRGHDGRMDAGHMELGGTATATAECPTLEGEAEDVEGYGEGEVEEDEQRPGHGSLLGGCKGGARAGPSQERAGVGCRWCKASRSLRQVQA